MISAYNIRNTKSDKLGGIISRGWSSARGTLFLRGPRGIRARRSGAQMTKQSTSLGDPRRLDTTGEGRGEMTASRRRQHA